MTVTLETLRADFEAAIDSIADDWAPNTFDRTAQKDPEFYLTDWMPSAETCCPEPDEDERRAERLAHMYLIARDYGLDAAMLYRLSDGNIDPRVKP